MACEDVAYEAVNQPLVVAESGTEPVDPDRWQPLLLETSVLPFAIETQPPLDQGPPPLIADPATAAEYREGAVVVLAASADLEVGAQTIDIGPGSSDIATLPYESSGGHDENPPSDGLNPDDRLRWDVQLGLGLNGALHDAAITA
jgi:hypothetical protein